jgi:hypothetical protein
VGLQVYDWRLGSARRRGPDLGRQGRISQLHRPCYTGWPPSTQPPATRRAERLLAKYQRALWTGNAQPTLGRCGRLATGRRETERTVSHLTANE